VVAEKVENITGNYSFLPQAVWQHFIVNIFLSLIFLVKHFTGCLG